jgi:hypothetical protein
MDPRSLEQYVELYVAHFGDAPPPATADDLLERAEERGPHVQNALADALHRIPYAQLADAVRRTQRERRERAHG